jgi:hypothetical protein
MNVEIDTGSEYKAVVTFASRKEHDRFCSDAPAWSRLHYRWTGNDNPFPESIFMVVDRLIGGKVPETFPHEEVVTDSVLAHVAGALLVEQTYRFTPPETRSVAQQLLTPILGYLERKADLAVAADELAVQSILPNSVPFNQEM